ncbi:MAG: hypothetical protein ACRDUV_25570 [Pseudonocardiaceae bacterium]
MQLRAQSALAGGVPAGLPTRPGGALRGVDRPRRAQALRPSASTEDYTAFYPGRALFRLHVTVASARRILALLGR